MFPHHVTAIRLHNFHYLTFPSFRPSCDFCFIFVPLGSGRCGNSCVNGMDKQTDNVL